MEILHLLPAALETLFSVYWLNACEFCTVDVNNTKEKTQESCRNKGMFTLMWVWNLWLQQTNFKSSIFCCQINIRLASRVRTSTWNCYWAQGQTTPHCCFCTNFCQCFLFSVTDWPDFIDWLALDIYCDRNLWATESEHCSEKSNAATTWSGDIQ